MLKLKLQYFGHQMWRTDSLEKTLMQEKIEGRRRRGQQKMRWLDGIADSVVMSLNKSQGLVMGREAWPAVVQKFTTFWTWLSNWAELNWTELILDNQEIRERAQINDKNVKGRCNWHQSNTSNHNRPLQVKICQQNRQSRGYQQILRNVQLSKTEWGRNRKYKETNLKYWNLTMIKNLPTILSPEPKGFTGEPCQIF